MSYRLRRPEMGITMSMLWHNLLINLFGFFNGGLPSTRFHHEAIMMVISWQILYIFQNFWYVWDLNSFLPISCKGEWHWMGKACLGVSTGSSSMDSCAPSLVILPIFREHSAIWDYCTGKISHVEVFKPFRMMLAQGGRKNATTNINTTKSLCCKTTSHLIL